MSFLPIVQRELRVSSRRKATHYVRAAGAMLGIVIGFFMLLFASFLGSSITGFGLYVLAVISWYALLMAVLAGIFLASDCLSEERREGTLGLLFLTDLKGYDVVLGKFMAVSLNAFYGLLAVFPVLALTLLAGGVSAAAFWRTCLALLNLLFFSVTAGMLISSFCRSSYRAMTGSIALLLTWLAVSCIASAADLYYVSVFSPFTSFLTAPDAHFFRLGREYWTSLAVSHVIGWVFLGWASWRMRTYVETAKASGVWYRIFTRGLLSGTAARRARLLEINPVLWLLDDSRRLRWVVWLLSLGGVLALAAMVNKGPAAFLGNYVMWPFYFLLKVFFAIQTCRFFSEARRTGALELLCCTPLTIRAMIRGQEMLLRRVFLWPLIVLLATHSVFLLYTIGLSAGMFPASGPGAVPFGAFMLWYQFKVIPNNIADFFAICWFGMWLALSMPRPHMAAGLTILSVVILPMIVYCVPTLAVDTVFIIIGVARLLQDFRLLQAQMVKVKPVA